MQNITYVTGNYGKYISVKEKFETHQFFNGSNNKTGSIDIIDKLWNT